MQLFYQSGPSLTFYGFLATLLSVVFSAMALWISNKRKSQTVIEELHGFSAREDERLHHPHRKEPHVPPPTRAPAPAPQVLQQAPKPMPAQDVPQHKVYGGSETSALFGSNYPYSPVAETSAPATESKPADKNSFRWE